MFIYIWNNKCIHTVISVPKYFTIEPRIQYVWRHYWVRALLTLPVASTDRNERLYIQQLQRNEKKIPLNQTKCLIAINQKLIWDTILLRFALLVGIRLRHFYLKRYGPNSKERTIWVYPHFINDNNSNFLSHSFTFQTNIPWRPTS